MRTQVGRVLAGVVVVGAVVSGCGGPNQAGAAVIVGNDTVSLEQVQSQVQGVFARPDIIAGLKKQNVDPTAITRRAVSTDVMHKLLQSRAQATGVVVPDAAVDAYIAAQGGTGTQSPEGVAQQRDEARDVLIAGELGKRAVGGLVVTADLIAAASKTEADQIAQVLAAGGPAADKVLATNPQIIMKAGKLVAAIQSGVAGTVVFGTPAGSTVVFADGPDAAQSDPTQPQDPTQTQWIVARILDRQTNATADPATIAKISQDQLASIGRRSVQMLGAELGVTVNPRYGVWDPTSLSVVAADSPVGKIIPNAKS